MAREIYRNAPRENRKQGRYVVKYWDLDDYQVWDRFRFKWVAIFFARMRREDYDVVVYDTKEDK